MRVKHGVNLNKAIGLAIVINTIQVALIVSVTVFSIISEGNAFNGIMEQLLLIGVSVVVSWGAVIDVREAVNARKVKEQADMLENALGQLEDLNDTLRAQRHDFMNHLQVVFSLIELGEHKSAANYIEKIFGDIQKVGKTLKTSHPAINALLAAKISDCEGRGIAVDMKIESTWQLLPVSSWEMCRVLGNIIDNAMDALRGVDDPEIGIYMGEDIHGYSFQVKNNGPMIPGNIRDKIFQRGFSTKNVDRGMGLSIVNDIVTSYGGTLELRSDERETAFTGFIVKPIDNSVLAES